jgi:hypothetical protein
MIPPKWAAGNFAVRESGRAKIVLGTSSHRFGMRVVRCRTNVGAARRPSQSQILEGLLLINWPEVQVGRLENQFEK